MSDSQIQRESVVCVCVCVCVSLCVCVCMRVRERECEIERDEGADVVAPLQLPPGALLGLERKRERECVCVCKRERGGESQPYSSRCAHTRRGRR